MAKCNRCDGEFEGGFLGPSCPECVRELYGEGSVRQATGGTTSGIYVVGQVTGADGHERPIHECTFNPGTESLLMYRALVEAWVADGHPPCGPSVIASWMATLANGLHFRIEAMLFAGMKAAGLGLDDIRQKKKEKEHRIERLRVCAPVHEFFPSSGGLKEDVPLLHEYLAFIWDARSTFGVHQEFGLGLRGTVYKDAKDSRKLPYSEKLSADNHELFRRLYTAAAQIYLWSLRVQYGGDIPDRDGQEVRDQEHVSLPPAPYALNGPV